MTPAALTETCEEAQQERLTKRVKFDAEPVYMQEEDFIPPHPLGVKPQGNAYTSTTKSNLRHNVGYFASLPDELIAHFLEYLDSDQLLRLGSTCKALHAFTRADDLWRALFVE
jgi:hypothetical protein